jgi:hypothetical protein
MSTRRAEAGGWLLAAGVATGESAPAGRGVVPSEKGGGGISEREERNVRNVLEGLAADKGMEADDIALEIVSVHWRRRRGRRREEV